MMLRTIASSRENQKKHPLQLIAERNWKDESHPGRLLSLEFLSTWLAERFELDYYRIDPLKVDVKAVTDVMSYAYAARFNVLPVRVDDETITVATCEPGITEWETELSNIHHKKIHSSYFKSRRY